MSSKSSKSSKSSTSSKHPLSSSSSIPSPPSTKCIPGSSVQDCWRDCNPDLDAFDEVRNKESVPKTKIHKILWIRSISYQFGRISFIIRKFLVFPPLDGTLTSCGNGFYRSWQNKDIAKLLQRYYKDIAKFVFSSISSKEFNCSICFHCWFHHSSRHLKESGEFITNQMNAFEDYQLRSSR